MKRQGDLTKGPIGRQLLLFALPLLGASFIQQLYNMVDLLFVGNLLGKEATAAVGASSLLAGCMVGFFTGLSVGTGVVISLAVGQDNKEKIQAVIHTAAGVSLAGGILFTAAGLLLSRQILLWMRTPEEILDEALVYVRIYLLSMLPLFLYNMNSGIIRARGDSRTPMLFQLLGAGLNILFDWVSMRYWGMGVAGAAWATFGSQLAAAVCSVLYLAGRKDEYHLSLRRIRISGKVFREVLRIGVPAGLQNLVITLSNVFVQTAVNGLGVNVIAAFTAYFKVELILYLPIVAFGQAATTFAGQNLGAGRVERLKKGVKTCIRMGILYAVFMAAALLVFGNYAFLLFSRDPEVVQTGLRIIRVTFPFYWLYVILEVHADALRGIGKSVPPMAAVLLCMCVFRTVLLAVFTGIWDNVEAVAAAYPSAWLAAALSLTLCWRKDLQTLEKFGMINSKCEINPEPSLGRKREWFRKENKNMEE